jgi:hypothetical protein
MCILYADYQNRDGPRIWRAKHWRPVAAVLFAFAAARGAPRNE